MAQPDWTGEFEIEPALAGRLVEAQFPQLAPVRIEVLGRGWDNLALLVNGRYVFRFPRRRLGVELLDAELRVLPAIAGLLPLPVTAPTFVGEPSKEFTWRFAGYPIVPGMTACRARLDASQRRRIASTLGEFLKALHSIPTDFARRHGAKADSLRRLDVPYRLEQIYKGLEFVVAQRLCDDIKQISEWLKAIPPDYRARADTLVHGDLYARHLVIDDAQRLAGVIDWGDVHLGDPATDLMAAWLLLPAEAREGFFTAYGPVDDLIWQAARFRALSHTLNVIPYARQTDDRDLLDESLRALSHLL